MAEDVGYCESEDVREVLQEESLTGSYDTQYVAPAIRGVSKWLRKRTSRHWFDSAAAAGDLRDTSARSVSDVVLDVPSSPHRQDRQLTQTAHGMRYPVTQAGPYAKIRLPHYDVQSLTTLEVRDRGGGVTDWVADTTIVEGRGEDYYLTTQSGSGATHLYLHAGQLGARVDFGDLLTLSYDYGVEPIPDSVRRAVALLAASELVEDDDVAVAIPEQGQTVSRETKADDLEAKAKDRLDPWLETPVA